ncbi:hypothetical protein D9756_001103 [Leucocoprinus leucothites]|uniref:Uncharacterized protein n=1 Tax=Leucocoprinus leucothites TaxID=201217 RepID=A0A8H5GF61_9AGAR|nr:hypothetical protein D9756_001103 [Leucoagaricus leucothites]
MANSTLPNPDVYLNHLTPDLASQFEITRDVYLAFLGVAIWDVLIYIPEDIKIILSNPIGATMICFISTRLLAIVYMMLLVFPLIHPVADCNSMEIAMGFFCVSTLCTTSFLFLRRCHAVFSNHRKICWFFSFLWFGASVVTILGPLGIKAMHIPGTGYCTFNQIHSFSSVSEFLPAAFDASVFLGISYKLIFSYAEVRLFDCASWKTFIKANLPPISRALLRGCQHYYMIVFVLTIPAGILLYLPGVPVMYRPMLTFTNHVVATSMACRVFRNLKNLHPTVHSSGSAGPRTGSDVRFIGDVLPKPAELSQQSSFSGIDALAATRSSMVVLPVSVHHAPSAHW